MNYHTLLQSESCGRWITWMTDSVATVAERPTFRRTLVTDAHVAAQKIAEDHCDFAAFMEDIESDQMNAEAIDKADMWIADSFYGGSVETMRSIRQRLGHSQAAVAEMIGTSQAQIAKIESGKTNPQLTTILRLADAMRTDPNTICAALQKSLISSAWRHG